MSDFAPTLIDTHCHIHFPAYDANRNEVLARMREERVWGITVGTSAKTSREAVAFAEAHDGIWATAGYHPEHFSSSYHDESEGDAGEYSIDALRKVALSSKKVVAIGETGLDFFRIDEGRNIPEAKAQQEQGLRDQIKLASECDLPLVIHCRDAFMRLAEIIAEEQKNAKNIRGVIHCFTGTWKEAQPLLDLGFHLSFTGIITFPAKKTQDPETLVQRVIERMPMDKMLIETDAPWLTPIPHRGEQNEPAYVGFVAQKIAELRGMPVEEIARRTTQNARELFGL